MKKSMPIGIDDFKEVREKNYFVDKTFFIQDLIDGHSKVTLITRPRRFGKTLIMSMLKYYFGIENAAEHKKLFEGLAVGNSDAHYMQEQGKYPVVFITLKGIKAAAWDESYKLMKRVIQAEYMKHRYLLHSEKIGKEEKTYIEEILSLQGESDAYKVSLGNLTSYLHQYYGVKPILLIDEYDVPMQCGWENGYYDEAVFFMKEWLNYGLKTNTSLEFSVVTGVMRIAKESIFSDLNNLDVCSLMAKKYNDVFGFTQKEIELMIKTFEAENKLDEIKEWYNGYNFNGVELYNPWAVAKYIDAGCIPEAYWVNTSSNGIVGELLRNTGTVQQRNLIALLEGKTITASICEGVIYSDIYKDKDALYTMLMTTGYLKVAERKSTDGFNTLCKLAIPNREIRAIYRFEVLDKMRHGLATSDLLMMMENLLEGNTEEFAEALRQYLLEMASVYDTANKESFYHGFMLGMVALLVPTYRVESNRESGYGRFDLAIFPRDTAKNGVIMEFKVTDRVEVLENAAQEAVKQIKEKEYVTEFEKRGIQQVLKYGIAFCGKQLKMVQGI